MASRPLASLLVLGLRKRGLDTVEELLAAVDLTGMKVTDAALPDELVTSLFTSIFEEPMTAMSYRLVCLDAKGVPRREETWVRHGIYKPGPVRQLQITSELAVSPDGSARLKVPQLKLRALAAA